MEEEKKEEIVEEQVVKEESKVEEVKKKSALPIVILVIILMCGCFAAGIFFDKYLDKKEDNSTEEKGKPKGEEEPKVEEDDKLADGLKKSAIQSVKLGDYSLDMYSSDTGGMDAKLQEKEKYEHLHDYSGGTVSEGCKNSPYEKEVHTLKTGDVLTIACPSDTDKYTYTFNDNKLDIEEDFVLQVVSLVINDENYIMVRGKYLYLFEEASGKMVNKLNTYSASLYLYKNDTGYYMVVDGAKYGEYQYFTVNDNQLHEFPYKEDSFVSNNGDTLLWDGGAGKILDFVEVAYSE